MVSLSRLLLLLVATAGARAAITVLALFVITVATGEMIQGRFKWFLVDL